MAADGVTVSVDEPDAQKRYWLEHSRDLTMEAVLFDSQAADIDREERPEVISLLPAFEGKSVLELGAGIGRLTGEFAKCAGKVVAVDFIESMTKKNETINGHFKNASFICADVRSPELNFEDESLDLIFSNWLLMYLTEAEVKSFAQRMLKWVKVGGFIFFRESCFHQSGDTMRKVNPTYYREPRFYSKVFQELHLEDGHNSAELSLVTFKRIKAYVKNRGDQNQICWLWQKVGSTSNRDFQKFVDNVPYTGTRILRYERIFGQGFVSPGGIDVTREFVKKLDLKPGHKVLDVGCGTGVADFYMAENFDVEVLGIDLSINMLSFAFERAMGRKCTVEFEYADCNKKDYPENTFDVIYSREDILHIQFQDKPSLFQRFHKWLKPGGKVLISDYCRSTETPSKELQEYIEQGGYDLHDIETYGKMLKNAGFIDVTAEDRTNQFLEVLRREFEVTEKDKQEFIHDFSEEDYDDIVNNWKGKLKRSSAGEQRWVLFIALKK